MTVLSVLIGTQAHAAAAPVRYTCGGQREILIKRDHSHAIVRLNGRSYELRRKQSSIGEKYISPVAALIIDGASAVFVAQGHLDLGACTAAVPLASDG